MSTTDHETEPQQPRTPLSTVPKLRVLPRPEGWVSPAQAPSLAWHRRTSSSSHDGQHRITVPCVLPEPPAAGVHAQLTAELRRRWVERPVRRGAWQITGVVAAFEGSQRFTRLNLAITASRRSQSPPQAIDDPRMARELTLALVRAFRADHSAAESRTHG